MARMGLLPFQNYRESLLDKTSFQNSDPKGTKVLLGRAYNDLPESLRCKCSTRSSQKLLSAAAAKSLQSCPTLCDPIDGSPPGSPVPGILQARTLDWVAISFSNSWKWKVRSLSRIRLLVTPCTAAYQAPLSMGFSRQEYSSGVPLPSSNSSWAISILKDDAVKVLHSICQQIWKTQQWPQDWKRSVLTTIPKKGNAKNAQITTQLHSFHTLVK